MVWQLVSHHKWNTRRSAIGLLQGVYFEVHLCCFNANASKDDYSGVCLCVRLMGGLPFCGLCWLVPFLYGLSIFLFFVQCFLTRPTSSKSVLAPPSCFRQQAIIWRTLSELLLPRTTGLQNRNKPATLENQQHIHTHIYHTTENRRSARRWSSLLLLNMVLRRRIYLGKQPLTWKECLLIKSDLQRSLSLLSLFLCALNYYYYFFFDLP